MKSKIKANRLVMVDNLTVEEQEKVKGGQSAPEVMCCCKRVHSFKKDAKRTLEQQELR